MGVAPLFARSTVGGRQGVWSSEDQTASVHLCFIISTCPFVYVCRAWAQGQGFSLSVPFFLSLRGRRWGDGYWAFSLACQRDWAEGSAYRLPAMADVGVVHSRAVGHMPMRPRKDLLNFKRNEVSTCSWGARPFERRITLVVVWLLCFILKLPTVVRVPSHASELSGHSHFERFQSISSTAISAHLGGCGLGIRTRKCQWQTRHPHLSPCARLPHDVCLWPAVSLI